MSLVSIQSLYKNALLSQAVYSEINGVDISVDNNSWFTSVLVESELNESEYAAFSFIDGKDFTGTTALIAKDNETGRYTVAIDGTDFGTAGEATVDLAADSEMGLIGFGPVTHTQATEIGAWIRLYADQNNIPLSKIDITGHSGGGFLAVAVKNDFGDEIGSVTAISAPGQFGILGSVLNIATLGIFGKVFVSSRTDNLTRLNTFGDPITLPGDGAGTVINIGLSDALSPLDAHRIGTTVRLISEARLSAIANVGTRLYGISPVLTNQSLSLDQSIFLDRVYVDPTNGEYVVSAEFGHPGASQTVFVSESGGYKSGYATLSIDQYLGHESVSPERLEAALSLLQLGDNDPGEGTGLSFEDRHRISHETFSDRIGVDGRVLGGAFGATLASQLYGYFGGDNIALRLALGATGKQIGEFLGDILLNEVDFNRASAALFNGVGGALSVGNISSIAIRQVIGFATDPLDDLLDFGNPLAEQISDIAINTVATVVVTEALADLANAAPEFGKLLSDAGVLGIEATPLYDAFGDVVGYDFVAPDFAASLGGVIGGAIGSYAGAQLGQLLVGKSPEAAIGGSIGGAIGGFIGVAAIKGTALAGVIGTAFPKLAAFLIPGVGALIGAFAGAFLGSVLGSLFGGGGGTVAAEIHTGFDPNTGEFVVTDGLSTIRGGDGSIATQAAERHMEIMNTIVDAVGGVTFAGGHTNHGFVQDSGGPIRYLGGSEHGSFEAAFNHNIRIISNSLQIEGGDRYIKHVLANYTGGPVEGLFDDLGVAADYGAYLDNEVLLIEAIEAGDPLELLEWQNMLDRVAELGLDTADESDDVYRASYQGIQGTLANTYAASAYADVAAGATFSVESDAAADTTSSVLALDLDGDGLDLTNASDSAVLFDIDGDGFLEQTGWAGPSDGYLVIDNDNSGRIESVSEMVVTLGAGAANGGLGLADYDSNADGIVDAQDSAWAELRVWVDANQNGTTELGELLSLHRFGIMAFEVGGEDYQTNRTS